MLRRKRITVVLYEEGHILPHVRSKLWSEISKMQLLSSKHVIIIYRPRFAHQFKLEWEGEDRMIGQEEGSWLPHIQTGFNPHISHMPLHNLTGVIIPECRAKSKSCVPKN